MKNTTLIFLDGIPQQRVEGCAVDPQAFPGCILLPIEDGEIVLPSGTRIPEATPLGFRLDMEAGRWISQQHEPQAIASKWGEVRRMRDALIAATDWTQLADVPPATATKWRAHRQALRDVTKQGDPYSIVWPTPPVA